MKKLLSPPLSPILPPPVVVGSATAAGGLALGMHLPI